MGESTDYNFITKWNSDGKLVHEFNILTSPTQEQADAELYLQEIQKLIYAWSIRECAKDKNK